MGANRPTFTVIAGLSIVEGAESKLAILLDEKLQLKIEWREMT